MNNLDYLDKMFNECKRDIAQLKSDIISTKEHLKEANEKNEELTRQLEIEKHVSSSRKTTDNDSDEENELEGLYRQARDELEEVETMLFETE